MTEIDEYVSKIDNIHYEYSIGLDEAIKKVDALRKDIRNVFNEPSGDLTRILLNQICDSKNQEVITECLKDLLLYRKEMLSKLRIEYIITSIFDFIFKDFNLTQALKTIFTENYDEVFKHPENESILYGFIEEEEDVPLVEIKLKNSLIPFLKHSGFAENKTLVTFNKINEETINNCTIYLLENDDRFYIAKQVLDEGKNNNLPLFEITYVTKENSIQVYNQIKDEMDKNES